MNNQDKLDVKGIVKDEIGKFVKDVLDIEMKKVLADKNSKSRQEVLAIFKNSMEAVFKVLWQKRDFWKSDIH